MIRHTTLSQEEVIALIRKGQIRFAGNMRLKIYGTLTCSSGKRMKRENRVFFEDANEAIGQNYRPCGHCMKTQYQAWKSEAKG